MNSTPQERFEQLLSLLDNVTRNGSQASARCPAHDDQRNSLSVGIGDDGRLLVKCHAGCETADVVRAAGCTMADLFPAAHNRRNDGSARGRIVTTYDYRDERGKLLFQVCRMEPKDFRQRKPDGNGGWVWNTKGVAKVLYRLPELIQADQRLPVFIPEGEKDVERLRSHGLVATCNPGGAGKWYKKYNKWLRPDSRQHPRQR